MNPIAVFGIGSTHFRYTVATRTGEFLTEIEVEPTRPDAFRRQFLTAVRTLNQKVELSLTAVSVSCTGLVDREKGIIRELDTKTCDTIQEIDLRSTIRDEFDLPVVVENDCNAAALGEWRYGVDSSYSCVAHVTFGTGIGAGVVERGRLLRGESGQSSEVGLFPIAPTTDLDSFGVPGA